MAGEPRIEQRIVDAAEEARLASAGKSYKVGGSSTDGFDCSGFVIYVFNKVHGSGFLPRITADGLKNSVIFFEPTGERNPGDLVFFSTSGAVATHVGIVAAADRWIGSQSSTGVAYVKFDNVYWSPKLLCYRRLAALREAV
jgi:cell wall-associated NlpC family hydrolase